jgi:hypothetical protein
MPVAFACGVILITPFSTENAQKRNGPDVSELYARKLYSLIGLLT